MIVRNCVIRQSLHLKNIFRMQQSHSILLRPLTNSKENGDENSEPVPFLNSPAAKYEAREYRRSLHRSNKPEYEPLIISLSLMSFLCYFCILREENDLDEGFSVSLFETVPDLELVTLMNKRKLGTLTEDEKLRLEELEK